MILGLDISTSITGLAILNSDGQLVYTEHIDLRKIKDIYQKAIDVVVSDQKASTSYIQRRLGIGYNKAANIIIDSLQRFTVWADA